MADLSVRYGATTALHAVSLDLKAGEVHAVVGENGAGKSTLLRAIAGAARAASGAIRIGKGVRLAWAPQEMELPPDLTAAEWIFLADERRGRFGWLRAAEMHAAARAALDEIGCAAAADARLAALAAPQRKQVQLARALRPAPDVLLLDEPTAVLGEHESARLFAAVRRARARGAGVLYVSHRLQEVLDLADRVTVLRDGALVSTDDVRAVDVATLVQRMVGRAIPERARQPRPDGAVVLRLTDVAAGPLRGLSLTLRAGEIVGLAGLVGAGRSAALEATAGLRPLRAGRVECIGRAVLVPEDRARKGLVGALGLRENLFLPADGFAIDRRRERLGAAQWIDRLAIRAGGVEVPIDALSGGNQQKLLLARALRHAPPVLLLDEPTAGVDVGAKAEIHALIEQLAAGGAAILVASSDLPELLALCDRIVALYRGAAVGELGADEAAEETLAAYITGARSPKPEA